MKNKKKVVSQDSKMVNIRVDPDLYMLFTEACARHDITVSQVLRAAMRGYVANDKKERQRNE